MKNTSRGKTVLNGLVKMCSSPFITDATYKDGFISKTFLRYMLIEIYRLVRHKICFELTVWSPC